MMVNKKKVKVVSEDVVYSTIRKFREGVTITDLVNLTGLSRSAVRMALARLDGAKKVRVRAVGMAKVYSVGGRK